MLKINGKRLQRSMEEMAKIGATPGGGVNRLTLSDEDREARDLFSRWAREADLSINIDEMGNMFARREGEDKDAPPLMAGSHLDSVPNGGRFDGSLGVLAALEIIRSMNEQDLATRRPIEIVNWTNEEGPRFPPSMLGSGVFAGAFKRDFAYEVRDSNGKRFVDELERISYRGEIPCRPRPFGGYLELHVEQGPALITEGTQIGIVEGIRGLTWLRITMKGVRDHAGPTPMHMRKDALVGAARTITAIRDIPSKIDPDLVTTVGEINVSPNAINVIPERVIFSVDFRHQDESILKRTYDAVLEAAESAAKQEGLELEVKDLGSSTPIAFDESVTEAIENACEKLGYTHMRLWSAAGHDARYAADLCPTAMIFAPSVNGKSHAEDELTNWEDVTRSCEVLGSTLIHLANLP
ncbi:MAG: Zn-dependent hydrolase [Nitrospinaceae bacterium]|jgi:beta-ureidopropionase / N-carbamoyl-L-amino-acid hydrolase|nr:Zn-dependent hydrolase [Nitrospinaceae bacterium]MBT3433606.1 Zn-dependent hydrolase [Nitrospinaceae bacterium]MBT3823255.1 Zn-dependent hydrolase [Nitrospinaceae bacterium]MBT4095766.1 Zn-dependent hydrolase [Nitrospinaceae bacterium]MBT4430008.1 Zn-dependent hydrolase [Nitrospinaceae bacterium]